MSDLLHENRPTKFTYYVFQGFVPLVLIARSNCIPTISITQHVRYVNDAKLSIVFTCLFTCLLICLFVSDADERDVC